MGDLNGHNPLRGSDHCDSRGRLFEEVFNDLNLRILNDGSPTYCHPASGSKSMLDLSVADPSLFLDLTWTIVDDLHGSDHFPVLVQFSQVEKAPNVGRWDFRNVNWDLYSDLCASAVTGEAVFSGEDPALQFTHLPESVLSVLLKVYNSIWESEIFPPSWREAVVVPIAKAGKDPKNPTNYRPIALTSCLCKTMDRVVNARLMCLESEGHLSDVQCGRFSYQSNIRAIAHLPCL